MSDVDDVVAAWTGLWQQWMDAWGVAARAVLELRYQEQRVPGVNDARVRVPGSAPSAPSDVSTAAVQGQGQGQAVIDLEVTPLVDEHGHAIAVGAMTLEPTPDGPESGGQAREVVVTVTPPPGTPSGFYTCTLRRADGTVVADDVWMYVVQPD